MSFAIYEGGQLVMTATTWSLGRDSVAVWYTLDPQATFDLAELGSHLVPSEKERADRFVFEADRARFILSRGLLRRLLGRYLGMEPLRVPLVFGPFGKPQLTGLIEFNVSHSSDCIALAFAADGRVGIDVQKTQVDRDIAGIVSKCLTARELDGFNLLPDVQRVRCFYRYWSCKEAVLKGFGTGLTRPMRDLEISISDDPRATLLDVAWDPSQARRWSVRELDLHPAYTSAVAFEGERRLQVAPLRAL